MAPKDLMQLLKSKIEVDNQFRESPVIIELNTEGKTEKATVAIEVEGKVRIIELSAKEIGTYDMLVIGA